MSVNSICKPFDKFQKNIFLGLFLLPVVFFIFHPGEIPFPKGSEFTDLLISHFPNSHFLRRTILENHVIPFWNPGILSGAPFLENPLSGFWYPPGWLALIWDSPASLFLLEILHLVWGGVGMYYFLRKEGCSKGASIVGGVSFELMPKVVAHMAAGHVSLVYAISWTPWLLLAELESRKSSFSLKPAIIWALIIFADVRWAAYAIILWFLFLIKNVLGELNTSDDFSPKLVLRGFLWWMTRVVFALGISAPFLFPFYKLVVLSTRNTLGVEDSMELSLPVKYLMSFLFPDFGGYAEWITYFGGIAVLVIIFSFGYKEYRRKNKFWLAIFCSCVFFSLGSLIPGLDFLFSLPGVRLLRVPTRFLFLAGFSISVLAAHLIDTLIILKNANQLKRLSISMISMVVVISFELMLSIGILCMTKSSPQEFFWGAGILLIYGVLIIVWLNTRFLDAGFLLSITILTMIDFGVVGISQFDFVKWEERLSRYEDLLDFFHKDAETYRIYSPSYSIPQDIASYGRLELADGVDPLQLRIYSDFMRTATGVNSEAYSVTLPAFKNGNPEDDNRCAVPDLALLGKLNVKYIVSEFEIIEPQLMFIKRFGQTYLYQNPEFLPRAWIERDGQTKGVLNSNVEDLSIQPNNVRVRVEGPGRVVISELDYPEWVVYLDGVKVDKGSENKLLRALDVEEGLHNIEWKLFPREMFMGIGIALATCLISITVKKQKLNGE